MPDNITSEATNDVKQEVANSETTNSQVVEEKENKADNKYVPYDRFKEVIEKKNQTEQELQELRNALKQKEEKELAEKEEYKTLYEKSREELESYKPYQEKVNKYEEVVNSLVQQELEAIKQRVGEEKYNDIIDLLDLWEAEPLKLLEKLPKIKKLVWEEKQTSWWEPIAQNQTDEKAEFETLKRKVANKQATWQEIYKYRQLMSKLYN